MLTNLRACNMDSPYFGKYMDSVAIFNRAACSFLPILCIEPTALGRWDFTGPTACQP